MAANDTTEPADGALLDFATPREVQDFTKGKLKAEEPRVIAALSAISASMRNEAGWHIWPVRTDTLTLNGEGGTMFDLPTTKLRRVVSVVNAGDPLDVDAVDWSEAGQIQRMDGGLFTRRMGRLIVTIEHGYDSVPDLKAMCMALVARGLASPFGATQESAGSLSVSWGGGVGGGAVQAYSGEISTLSKYSWVTP